MFDVERPFNRLVQHFIYRSFHGGGEDGGELQFGIPILLGLFSVPSAFSSIMLLNKYSTLRLYLMHLPDINVYLASIPDEYFFIVYSMAITGAIVVLKWDRLFPDRQDFDNLAPLPLSMRQIFAASLTALVFMALLFAADINIAACFIFPFAVTSKFKGSSVFFDFFFAHGAAMILSSLFACFALLAAMGATMLVTPSRYLRTVSLAVRITCASLVVVLVGSAFAMPPLLGLDHPPAFLKWVPSVWFLDLYESMLGQGRQVMGMARFGVSGTAITVIVALVIYALTYYRTFTRIPEQAGIVFSSGRDKPSLLRRGFDRFVLRTPFQQAVYHFSMKTLFRSERHCLLFGGALSIGFFLAGQSISDSMAIRTRYLFDPRLLAVPLILAYSVIVSLRALFDLTIDGNANWVFRALIDLYRHESRVVGVKIMLSLIVPWLLLFAFPVYARAWGWQIALFHVVYVLVCSAALAQVLLVRFRKIPFTCKRTVNKDRVLVNVIVCMVGLGLFTSVNASFEASLLVQPMRALFLLPWFAAIFWAVRAIERDAPWPDRVLLFDDHPSAELQTLDLMKTIMR